MGYFNYFIKCIIRNIAYRLCKPKILFTVLLAVAILFGLKHFGYCALDDADYEMISDGFATITSNQGTIISQLSSMGVNVTDIENELKSIQTEIDNIGAYTSNINENVITILNRLNTLNTNVLNIYNTLEENQQELITELQTENQKVLDELEEIKKILIGSSETVDDYYLRQGSYFWLSPNVSGVSTTATVSFTNQTGTRFAGQGFRDWTSRVDYYFEKGYTYNINISNILTSGNGVGSFYYTYDELIEGNEIYCYYLGNFSQNNFNINITPIKDGHITFFTSNMNPFWYEAVRFSITKTSAGSLSSIGENLNNVNSSINQGNQLQQEQNDLIKDDNVNTDGLEFATDDTVNPTTDGFNTLFNTVYNAFCNTSSEPLTITLPYINETFTIQPNIVSNGMQKAGLGVIVSLINSFYYFSVCLFIYKDIAKIIDNLKSGNITADCGNVKTEVL